ncbi:MAG: arylsulfatase, partial [Bacteroidota bacterium]
MLRLALFIVAALALTGGIVTEAQLGSGGSVLPVGADEAQADDDTVRPNVLLIMTDDQGWGDLRVHGNPDLDTPVLDALARESVRFDRFYVSSVCAPTRASLLTGRDHLRTGVQWVTGGLETMRPEEVTIAEVYRDAGYATGLFGKWHSGAHYPADPRGQGFETVFGFIAGHLNNYFDTDLLHSGELVETEGYITDVLTDAAINFIEAERDHPFFAYVPYNAPHSPFQVPDAYFDKYVERGFDARMASIYGMVENIDTNVGRLLAALDATGQAEQTIVVFLTDNGPNGVRYNGGMRGTKASVHEGGVRVPLFIRYPNQLPADHVVRPLAAHIDLLPTLAELSDVPLPDSLDLDGRSLAPLMRDAVPSADWPERRL